MNTATTGLALTDTQQMLRDSLARYLGEQYDVEIRARTLAAADDRPPLWRAFAHELGLLGASFSESTVVLGGGLLRSVPGAAARQLLGRVIDGDAVVAFASTEPQGRHALHDVRSTLRPQGDGFVLDGRKAVVHCAPWATDLLVTARSHGGPQDAAGLSLAWLPVGTPGIRRRDYRTLDGGRASELQFDAVAVPPEQVLGEPGGALPLLERVVDEATLAVCAEATGVLSRLLEDTLDHARQRHQFGVPISSFQALQHRLADMHLALEQARALTAATAPALSASPEERARAVSSAKVCVGRACRIVGQGAVQIHGGMGMTEELAVGHYFRRASQIEQMFGSVDHHLRRVERLAAGAAA